MTFLEQLKADHGRKLMIGGHRGHLSEVRENTIENYKQILGSGISHIEIDIQLTKDDVAVIYHDYELSERTKIAAATKNLLAAAEVAEDAGLTLQLEPVSTYAKPGYYMTTSASAAEIIRVVDSPRLKLLYDIYHMQLMEGDLANTIRANADVIGYIHIGDVPGRHEPGTGEINYPFLKRLLVDELKFDGIFAFELSPLTTLDACVEAMHAF